MAWTWTLYGRLSASLSALKVADVGAEVLVHVKGHEIMENLEVEWSVGGGGMLKCNNRT